MEKVLQFIMTVIWVYVILCAIRGIVDLVCELIKIASEDK